MSNQQVSLSPSCIYPLSCSSYPMFPGLDATLIHSPLRPPTAVAASSVPSLSVAVRLQAEKGKSRKV